MKNVRLVSILLVTGVLSLANAWNKVGNGGDALVCKNSDGKLTAELLDSYEAKHTYGLDVITDSNEPTDVKKAIKLIEKLKDLSPARSQMMSVYVRNFYDEVKFVNYELEDIPDHGFIKIPENCQIKQLIVNACNNDNDLFYKTYINTWGQITYGGVDLKKLMEWNQVCPGRYRVNQNIWDMLPIDQKAIALTHEAFMRDFRHMGDYKYEFDGPFHPIRYFNILLFTDKIKKFKNDFDGYQKLYTSIGRLDFPKETWDGRLTLSTNNSSKILVPFINVFIPADRGWMWPLVFLTSPNLIEVIPTDSMPRGRLIFETNTRLNVPKNNYSNEMWLVTGKVSAITAFNGDIYDADQFGLSYGQTLSTGFSLNPFCYPENEDFVGKKEIYISNYKKDNFDSNSETIEYTASRGFSFKNDFLDIFVYQDEKISEQRSINQSNECHETLPNYRADYIWLKAKGKVYVKDRWIKLNDPQRLFIDLKSHKVELRSIDI